MNSIHYDDTLQLGKKILKNRIIKSPQSTYFWNEDQTVSEKILNHYEAIAKGGASMIVIAALQLFPCQFGRREGALYADSQIPGMKNLTNAIHKHNCLAIAQLIHDGASDAENPRCSTAFTEEELPCPPEFCSPCTGVSLEEIAEMKKAFVNGAIRAQKAGFDGVEVHSANAYFLVSFLSRIWNKRTDEYGCQNMENRTRLQREIIREIRKQCGEDFIVGFRMNGIEFGHERALTIEEGVEAAKLIDKEQVDYISVTGYGFGKNPMQYVADYWPYPEADNNMKQYLPLFDKGLLIPAAAAIKKAVQKPVFAGGRLDAESGEKILEENLVDAILFGRPLWADPDLPNKILSHQNETIIRCMRCATCEHPQDGVPRRCRVNPAFGHEAELKIIPANTPKKILIIGAGPSGMEAAKNLAQKNHSVIICEKESQVGGKLHLAMLVKGNSFENIKNLITRLNDGLQHPNITLKLNTEVTDSLIEKIAPDIIINASGGNYLLPEIKGIHLPNATGINKLSQQAKLFLKFLSGDMLHTLASLFSPGIKKNIVIIGGQIEAIQGAVFLTKCHKKVKIITEEHELGNRMPPRYLRRALSWLKQQGVTIYSERKIEEIKKDSVIISHNERTEAIPCEQVLIFTPPSEHIDFIKKYQNAYSIGAAAGVDHSLIINAIHDAREIACKL